MPQRSKCEIHDDLHNAGYRRYPGTMTQNKKSLLLLLAVFVLLSTLSEVMFADFFGGDPIRNAPFEMAFFAAFSAVCAALWFLGIKIMHLDAKGPVPWYASPVLWLSPFFIITRIMMFKDVG